MWKSVDYRAAILTFISPHMPLYPSIHWDCGTFLGLRNLLLGEQFNIFPCRIATGIAGTEANFVQKMGRHYLKLINLNTANDL